MGTQEKEPAQIITALSTGVPGARYALDEMRRESPDLLRTLGLRMEAGILYTPNDCAEPLRRAALRLVLSYLRSARIRFYAEAQERARQQVKAPRAALVSVLAETRPADAARLTEMDDAAVILARAVGPASPEVALGERRHSALFAAWSRQVQVDGLPLWVGIAAGKSGRIAYQGAKRGHHWHGYVRDMHGHELWSGRVAKSTGAKGILRYAGFLERGV